MCEVESIFVMETEGQKFITNRFVGNFIQPTYKSDMYLLNI
jgi:hypothetical protein